LTCGVDLKVPNVPIAIEPPMPATYTQTISTCVAEKDSNTGLPDGLGNFF
jgi:hypothetical protein